MAFSFMIVDDSRSLRKVLIKTIRMCHLGEVAYLQAENGKQALEFLSGNWVDLIFTDINMPEMDGFALIEEVRKSELLKATPIVVITSETRRGELEQILSGRVEGIIIKPFRPEEIRDTIVNLLKLEGLHGTSDDSPGYDF